MTIKNIAGRTFPWKEFDEVLLLLENFNALACDDCDEIFLQGNDFKTLDIALGTSKIEGY